MRSPVGIQARKELRELLPWWGAAAVTVVAAGQVSQQSLIRPISSEHALVAGVFAYVAGSVALGALSIGHEYSYRALPVLLAQPIHRARVLATKLAILATLLAALFALAAWQLPTDGAFWSRGWPWRIFLILPSIGALLLTPWLTMVSRGPLGGAVFSVALPFVLFVIGAQAFTRGEAAMDFAFVSTLALVGAGGLLTWRTFLRLEAIDGPDAEIGVPVWLRRGVRSGATARRRIRHPLWLLALKELHIQQMTFVVSALFVVAWIAIAIATVPSFGTIRPAHTAITYIHGAVVALMAGALASGEERQLGTLDWQTLQPIRARTQWAIKAGVALALALILGFGLPGLFWIIEGSPNLGRFPWTMPLGAVLLTSTALWVSSLSTSGMRALLATFPVIAGIAVVFVTLERPRLGGAALLEPLATGLLALVPLEWPAVRELLWWTRMAMPAVLAGLLLAHAHANHRSADRGLPRVTVQVLGLLSMIVIFVVVVGLGDAVWNEALRARRP